MALWMVAARTRTPHEWSRRPTPQLLADPVPPFVNDRLLLSNGVHVQLERQLGEGRFCRVLRGSTHEGPVAVKVPLDPSHSLEGEAAVLRQLSGAAGFPRVYHARHGDPLVLELLGPSMDELWARTTGGTYFAKATVLRMGCGVLHCLRRLHLAGFLHNDVKPANVCLGPPSSERAAMVHLIDFGLATPTNQEAAPAASSPIGTPLFASIAAHQGRPTRAVDDVESLVYSLAFVASGYLPWKQKRHSQTLFMKQRMMTDGCEVLTDSCAAHGLTEEIHSSSVAEAIQALWAEVVACQETRAGVDYEKCIAALGGPSSETVPFEWEL
ncbi:hypothetical protein AB1Y20_007371 [Prymnesium parvum]|uniref:non-specific serine/threonine protein kinase n=1 Tax=Prymnesium parvum TaxID=97485 RepID=A0AB34IUM9_PRYPA